MGSIMSTVCHHLGFKSIAPLPLPLKDLKHTKLCYHDSYRRKSHSVMFHQQIVDTPVAVVLEHVHHAIRVP